MPTTFANTIDSYEILAKRSQCDYAGNDIATTYATKGEIPSVPVTDVEVDGVSVVSSGVASITMPTFTQAQANWNESDTSAASYIQNKPSIPSATSDLTNDSGFITLSDVPAQVNADWNSSSGASEILNKPTIPSGTQLVPAATSADADKVLTVDSQGTPAWASAQAPISAGNGIDITNNVVSVDTSVVATQTDLADKEDVFDVGTGLEMDTSGSTPTLQVEAPVDIVAGPGIVIDNPDGNTLRVSTEADAETVLWQGTAPTARGDSITLSESVKNFDRIALYWNNGNGSQCMTVDYLNTASAYDSYYVDLCHAAGYGNSWIQWLVLQINTTARTILFDRARNFNFGSQSSTTWTNPTITTTLGDAFNLYKVVGVHRIASN